MTTFTKSIYTVLLLTALLLTGCANAGKDQKVDAAQTVTLDGSKSKADLFGNVTGFKWKQVKLRGKSELKVTLTAKNTATPSFTAPSVEKKSILYFRLEATETGGIISPFSTKDTVQVEVNPNTTTNKAPKAKASANPKKVLEGEEVHFDGSASTDSDGQIVSYAWSDDEGTVLSTQQSFTHVFSTKGKHTLTLKVTDDEDASDSTTVRVKVKEAPTPKVSILVDQVYTSEKTVVQGTTLAFEAVLLEEDEHTDKKHHKNKKKHHKKDKKHHDDTPVYTWKDAQGNILSQEMGFSHTFTTVGTHIITLEVTEGDQGHGSKDMHTASVTIIVIDVTPPVITLNGEANITLEQNAVYTELGATAVDAVDGNLTVTISGTVDTAVVGTHTLTYTAHDNSGNEANVTRTITIIDVTPPVITLNGQSNITLEQNAVYTELGATAVDAVDGNVSVTISGTVDTSTIGSYTVMYTAQDSAGNEANVTRSIRVIDVTPPVITLNGQSNITLEQNAVYTELGATALDAVDGNVSVIISGNVDTSTVGSYTVTYTAQDNSSNESNVTRTITIVDVTPPVITLNGEANIILELGETYEELGASAVDNSDGNVSVEIFGTVDTTTIGEYTLTYRASDSSANTASLTRTITVEKTIDPPAVEISDELNTVLSEVTVPYNRMTFEIATTSTETLTAINTTLSQEQNRTIRVKGVDNNGTFYLYNIPLMKGENHIELNATNEAGESLLQTLIVNADANHSIPIKMRATEFEGVQSLETIVTIDTLLKVNEYLFDSNGDGVIDESQSSNDNNFTVNLMEEGRYRPRITIRTENNLLYSSEEHTLSLDVKASATQKDPRGAAPIDIAKEFVNALINDDREIVEELVGHNEKLIYVIYAKPEATTFFKSIYSGISSWEQTYHLIGDASISIVYEDNGTSHNGGFELMLHHSHGLYSGREWMIRMLY